MNLVPSLPPVIVPATDQLDVEALAAVTAAKPVTPRVQPPIMVQHHMRHHATRDFAGQQQRHDEVRVQGERRIYSRRIEHLPELVELRAGLDRRRHNQRGGDITEHVDEKI